MPAAQRDGRGTQQCSAGSTERLTRPQFVDRLENCSRLVVLRGRKSEALRNLTVTQWIGVPTAVKTKRIAAEEPGA